jgi:predicted lysophospholipase L1 biosynthesis ABC-type transport system permease subunit
MIHSQPHGATGTHDNPYSALRLRLVLAAFGIVSFALLAVLAARMDRIWLAALMAVPAAVGVVDAVVVWMRLRARP